MKGNDILMSKEESYKIQILRGTSILAVILIHTIPSDYGLITLFFRPFLNFAVPSFIFYSGYLTKFPIENTCSFFQKRIIKNLFPYIIWSIIYLICSRQFNIISVVKSLILGSSAGHMYYIIVYLQFVILTPLIGMLMKSKFKWIGWLISPLYYILFLYPSRYFNLNINSTLFYIIDLTCLKWFTFYYLGLQLRNNNLVSTKHFNKNKCIIIYLLATLLQTPEEYYMLSKGISNIGTQSKLLVLIASSMFCLLSYIFIKEGKVNCQSNRNILKIFGDYSSGIYFCHLIMIYLLPHIPGYYVLPYGTCSMAVAIASILFVMGIKKVASNTICNLLGF